MPTRAPGTQTRSCKWHDFGCHFMNFVKSTTNSVYQSFRRDFLAKLQRRLDAAKASAGENTAAYKDAATAAINEEMAAFGRKLDAGVAGAFSGYRIVKLVFLFYSLIVLLKSYMVVLARVLFHPDAGLKANILDGKIPDSQGQVRVSKEGDLIFPSGSKAKIYLAPRIKVSNCPTGARIPMAFSALLPRLANRTWQMKLIDLTGRKRQAVLSLKAPSSLIEWSLKKGERVIFGFDSFGGVGAGTKMGRLVTLNLAGLIFGRFVYYYAEGPGSLILTTNNAAIVAGGKKTGQARKASQSYVPGSFIAWNMRCRFSVDSNLTVNDTFRSSVMVQKTTGDHVVIDTESWQGRRVVSGILSYVRTFLLPI